MSLFGNLTTEGLEESQDRLGGGFQPLETDVYSAKITMAYAGTSKTGARNVTIVADCGGREYRETIYVTNRDGNNFFLNKQDNSKKVPLPGFTTVDELCLCATGFPLAEQNAEEKVIKLYDFEQRKELPTTVPVLMDLLNKPVLLAISKILENKSEKVGDKYEPTDETREVNAIEKAFVAETGQTVIELRQKLDAKFKDQWLERNKGNTKDKRTIKDGAQNGRPGGRPSNAPAPTAGGAGGQPAARKSLFG